jgi:transcriptional regulator with XRE-family HTH domain
MEPGGMEIGEHVGGKVRHLRLRKGWSQEELAFKSGLHRTYVSQVERADTNPTLTSLKRLADALSVPCWKLIEPK